MFDPLPLEMVFNVFCLRVDYSFDEYWMDSMHQALNLWIFWIFDSVPTIFLGNFCIFTFNPWNNFAKQLISNSFCKGGN